jgi:hypothetical protein
MSIELNLLNNYESVLYRNKDKFQEEFLFDGDSETVGNLLGCWWNSCSMHVEYIKKDLTKDFHCYSIFLWEEFYEANKGD